jgi:RNA recognition motif-containing protein
LEPVYFSAFPIDAVPTNASEERTNMGRRLYVGNLPYKATDEELTALFSTVGDVASARVMRDMATGRARGFGFVEMTTDEAAAKAIEKLHQHQMDGRAIVVNEAQPKPAGGGRNFGGGGGGFNRGGGGGRGGDDYGGGGGRREPRW